MEVGGVVVGLIEESLCRDAVCVCVCARARPVAQSCLTLCDAMD